MIHEGTASHLTGPKELPKVTPQHTFKTEVCKRNCSIYSAVTLCYVLQPKQKEQLKAENNSYGYKQELYRLYKCRTGDFFFLRSSLLISWVSILERWSQPPGVCGSRVEKKTFRLNHRPSKETINPLKLLSWQIDVSFLYTF